MYYILVADSGSTSTNWALLSANNAVKQINTSGINPYYMSPDEIKGIVGKELLPSLLPDERNAIAEINFYGSGCSTEAKVRTLRETLLPISPNASVFVGHDVLASARAACGRDKGIACILGTGSNSCVYDGSEVKKNAISLGYLLGDEGSGIHLGKLFLIQYLKKRLSPSLMKLVDDHFKLSFEEILNKLYQQEKPNRIIAPFSHFMLDHVQTYPELQEIVRTSFSAFVEEYIRPFPEAEEYPICFVGSVAFLMQEILRDVLGKYGYTPHCIIRYPIDGLIRYHQNKMH